MAAPVISVVATYATEAQLQATPATGTGPFEYQWHRSTSSGFTPGGANEIDGATDLTLFDSGLSPNTVYYYKLVSIDTGNSNLEQISTQSSITSAQQTAQENAMQQTPFIGQLDLQMNMKTVAAQVDVSETATLVAGQAVKVVDNTNGIPTVTKCAADSDHVFGFINFNPKQNSYKKGDRMQVSLKGNVMYMQCNAAISRLTRVVLEVDNAGSVGPASGSGGERIVGWAYDKFSAAGDIKRVYIETPSFLTDA
jgi:hypothetical protein